MMRVTLYGKKTVLVRCTKKLLQLLGEQPGPTNGLVAGVMTEWYANLLWIERRKCILFTDSTSLYSFLVVGVRKKELIDFTPFFTMHLMTSLLNHGVDPSAIPDLSGDIVVSLGRTRDRVVLGCMNDFAFHYKWHIASGGGLDRVAVPLVDRKINEMPMSPLEHVTALNTLSHQLRGLAT